MKYLPFLLVLLAILPLSLAVTIDSVTVTPTNATTSATLSCAITATGTGTLTANVTWFRNNASHASDNETVNLLTGTEGSTSVTGNVEAADTTKGEYWHCQATVSNTTTTTASNSSAVLIRNSPPTVTFPVTTQTVNEDVLYTQTATAVDADGDTILAWISSDLNASNYSGNELFDITNAGLISFTPAQTDVGNHTVALLAYDGQEFGGQNVLFTVTAVNDAPTFTATLANQTATATLNFSYSIAALDEENNALNFSIQTNASNLIINQTSGTQATIRFVTAAPTTSDIGLFEVNVTVYENATQTSNTTARFYINVSALNNLPELALIANQTGQQGNNFLLTINATDNDTADILSFSVTSACSLANPWTITTANNSSSNGVGIINLTLNNSHVVCPSVIISVYDYKNGVATGALDSQSVYLNITNLNDAPIIYNESYNASHTRTQFNISNLTAGTGANFFYGVNATDIDKLTYAGDTLTYTDNTTLFTINAATGVISFVPNASNIGNYLVQITVTDTNGSTANTTLNLTVESNGVPSLVNPGNVTCTEDIACELNFTATDADSGENLVFTTNESLVNITQRTVNESYMNSTFGNNYVSNYTVLLTVTDIYGHTNSTNFTITVNNTNDAPYFDNNRDNVSDTLAMPSPVVTGVQTTWLINISDPDFRNTNESVNFTSNITNGTNTGLFNITKVSAQQASIQFTPAFADIDNYTVNITVTDLAGLYASQLVSFAVVNASEAPNLTAVQPYYNGSIQTNTSLVNTTSNETNVSFAENQTVYFNVSYTDADSSAANVNVLYYIDGTLVSSQTAAAGTNYTLYLDFFSAGTFDVVAVVRDNLLSQDNFTWHVTVSDVNRPPVLASNVPDRVINQTTVLTYEMNRFVDPDDDLNSNGAIDLTETTTLTYSMSSSSYLTAAFSGPDVTLTPVENGLATVVYTATDSGSLTATSNVVTYTVFYDPVEESVSTSSSSSGGGGGGGGSNVITKQVKTPDPYSLEILTPKPITIYDNDTVIAPLAIKNNGQLLLSGITLTAKTDANVTLSFLDDEVVQLQANESFNTSLIIKDFKYSGTYEVFVTASVNSPSFNDSAVFYINSLEKTSEGSAVNTKITYARDLLTANPECGELVQLVNQAEQAYKLGDGATAEELLRAVSEGCTYLRTQVQKEVHAPTLLQSLAGYQYINLVLGGFLVLLLLIGGLLVMHYARQQ
jgi:hypothetical protein